jgi:hypothetical protein
MARGYALTALLILTTATAPAQTSPAPPSPAPAGVQLSLPATVTGKVGSFIVVPATTNAKACSWYVVDEPLQLFPVNLLRSTTTAVVTASKDGSYRILAVAALGDEVSDICCCTVVVGTPVPPGPTPPGPTPPGPQPGPAPIPVAVLRVLLLYKATDLTKVPPKQQEIFFDSQVRDYLAKNCAPSADGKTRDFHCWDDSVDVSNQAKYWQDVMKRPRASLPWMIVSNPNKGGGYEGPLPGTVDEALAIVKKFAE